MAESSYIVLDNGAYNAKIGLSSWDSPKVVPNCMTKAKTERQRTFVGAELEDCRDKSGLYYVSGFQKGYMVNWDIERVIWDYMFSKNCLKVNPEECHLALTEPAFNFQCIQDALDEVIFEDYRFQSLVRHWGPVFSCYGYTQQTAATAGCPPCSVVVDMGHSFTHVMPFIQGKVISSAALRIDVGGKLMTNYLKDMTSYRQLNVMDETYVVNQMKEDCCFVTTSMKDDMRIAKLRGKHNTIIGDYTLPDFHMLSRGSFTVRSSDQATVSASGDEQLQSIVMNNERFTVPELLFSPSDIGVDQMGVCEAIVHSISRTPIALHPHFYRNIVVTGGSAAFPGMLQRLEQDLRMLGPADYKVVVSLPDDPGAFCWKSAAALASNQEHAAKFTVTREQYEEEGHAICQQKFRHESSL